MFQDMKEIDCIFCNKKSDEIVITENNYSCKRCSQCGLIFLSPRPTHEEIRNIYKTDHDNISAADRIASEFIKIFNTKHHIKLIRKFVKHGALLEIGPGGGQFLSEAKENGFDPYAIELNPKQAQFINNERKIPCEDQELTSDSFPSKMFDVIYHSDVLSHFYDPMSEFKKMNSKLKMNGYLIFETGILNEVEKKHFNLIPSFQLPSHLFFFSDRSIQHLLKRTGFSLIKIFKYSRVFQLRAINMINKVKGKKIYNGKNKIDHFNKSATIPHSKHSNILRTSLKKMYHYSLHFSRYNIGYILPKKHVPVTAIIVAKKVS